MTLQLPYLIRRVYTDSNKAYGACADGGESDFDCHLSFRHQGLKTIVLQQLTR